MMACNREEITADSFKKSQECSYSKISDRNSGNRILEKIMQNIRGESENSVGNFNNEDRNVAKLYRNVVDDMMVEYKLQEWKVNYAISQMKADIHQGHKKAFRRFGGIDFCKPTNRCGYLRRYAVCHTGLVKEAIWRFLSDKQKQSQFARSIVSATEHLKVVSLGGGPGNDLIGFCSALQEAQTMVKELDLKIVDISQGWVSVFPSILKRAAKTNSGSISNLLKKMKINTGFMKANLSTDGIFEDDTLSTVLGEADIVFMVKLASFISNLEAEELIKNVVNSMEGGALLIFIDHPYIGELFRRIPSLSSVFHHYLKYELSFNPERYHCPAISSSQAHIAVFEKEFEPTSEDDSDANDS